MKSNKTNLETNLKVDLDVQDNLMKAAQKFAIAFDQDRRFSDDFSRLNYTLSSWRES